MVYLDTSVLMAMLCPEAETDFVIGWFRQSDGAEIVSSPWARTELASALAIKLRTKQLSKKEAELALAQGLAVLATTRCEKVESVDFDEAATLCAKPLWNLRAPDALHLAVCQRMGCNTLATLDDLMQKAAVKLGLKLVKFGVKQ
jgi:predicted nucleic acid-binding protein